MQNKAPEGFEDGDRVRVDLRPESVSLVFLFVFFTLGYSEVGTVSYKCVFFLNCWCAVAVKMHTTPQADSQNASRLTPVCIKSWACAFAKCSLVCVCLSVCLCVCVHVRAYRRTVSEVKSQKSVTLCKHWERRAVMFVPRGTLVAKTQKTQRLGHIVKFHKTSV